MAGGRGHPKLAGILEASSQAFAVGYPDGEMGLVNQAFEQLTGYTSDELRSIDWTATLTPPEWREMERQKLEELQRTGEPVRYEKEYVRKDGTRVPIELLVHLVQDAAGKPLYYYSFLTDIMERKRAEAALASQHAELQLILDSAPASIFYKDRENRFLRVNRAFTEIMGLPKEQLEGRSVDELYPAAQARAFHQDDLEVLASGRPKLNIVEPMQTPAGERWMQTDKVPCRDATGKIIGLIGFALDITERKRAEALLSARLRLSELAAHASVDEVMQAALDEAERLTSSSIGFFHFVDKDQENLRLQAWSSNTRKNMCQAEGKGQHYPISQAGVWVDCFRTRRAVIHNDYAGLSHKKGLPAGHAPIVREMTVPILRDGAVVAIIGVGNKATDYTQDDIGVLQALALPVMDLVAIKQSEEVARQAAAELARSNKELEQFGYVASHDLQEPLRMVTGFVTLLQQRYQGRLDANADEYIGFAVEGVTRMQALITDLLAYSRVGDKVKALAPADLGAALVRALANLKTSIEEVGAVIMGDELPTVSGNPGQLTQLFQNLIGNAIKFRGERKPEIHVGAERKDGEWLFAVRDNGIGLDMKHKDRIFQVFQRLHTREAYPGTGIGLAICKKIVERHGGRIWVESQPGQGSTFYFTMPCRNT
jgi:PAS domain S-box-containing protein